MSQDRSEVMREHNFQTAGIPRAHSHESWRSSLFALQGS